jgi:hypothetical protein
MAAPRGPPRAGGGESPRPAGGPRGRLAAPSGRRLRGWPDVPGRRHGPPWRGAPGAGQVAGGRRAWGGPGLWLSPPGGHGGAPAGRRRGAAPPRDLPPGNRGWSALEWAALAAATRERQPGVARLVLLGWPARSRAAGRGSARSPGDAARQAPGTPQSPTGWAHAHGAHPGRGRVGVAHHPAGRGPLVDGGRAVGVARQVASGTGVEKNAATAAAQPDPQHAPHACRSDGPGAPDGLGLTGKHDDVAACPLVCHRVPRERRGEWLVGERAGTGDAAAAGAGPVVGGPSPGVPPSFAPLSMPSSTTSGTSGIRGATLAGTASWCTPGQTAKGGLKKG